MSETSTIVTIQDRSGVPVTLHQADGDFYPAYSAMQDFKGRLDRLREMELRSTDIIQLGYPRSGNHWIFETTNMILQGVPEFAKTGLGERAPETLPEAQLDAMANDTAPNRLIAGHLNFQNWEDQICEKKPRCIYILRNPKDVHSSLFNFVRSMKGTSVAYNGTWDDFFELAGVKDFWYGGWFNHVQRAERFQREHPDVPFHVICFEEMKQNPVKEIGRLAEFLGCKDAPVEEIATAVSFKNSQEKLLQSKHEKYQEAMNKVFDSASSQLLFKGEFGTWKKAFTVAQNEQFDTYFKSRMGDSVFCQRVQPYIM